MEKNRRNGLDQWGELIDSDWRPHRYLSIVLVQFLFKDFHSIVFSIVFCLYLLTVRYRLHRVSPIKSINVCIRVCILKVTIYSFNGIYRCLFRQSR